MILPRYLAENPRLLSKPKNVRTRFVPAETYVNGRHNPLLKGKLNRSSSSLIVCNNIISRYSLFILNDTERLSSKLVYKILFI